jgi:myosin-5
VWVADGPPKTTPAGRTAPTTWLQATVTAVEGPPGDRLLTVATGDGRELARVRAADCPLQNARDDALDDLVRADFLHEPG